MVIGVVTSEQMETLCAVAERLDARGLEDESRMLREVLAQVEQAPREAPASTAAAILEVTPQTVRNWVRRGLLPGRRDPTGHFYVSLDALETASRLRQALPDQPTGAITDQEIDAEIDAVRADRRARGAIEQ